MMRSQSRRKALRLLRRGSGVQPATAFCPDRNAKGARNVPSIAIDRPAAGQLTLSTGALNYRGSAVAIRAFPAGDHDYGSHLVEANVIVTERAARRIGEILQKGARAGTMLRRQRRGRRLARLSVQFDTERARADDDIASEERRHGADRSGLAQLHDRQRDRLRRRLIGSSFKVNNPQATGILRLRYELRPLSTKQVAPVRIPTWNVNSIQESAPTPRAPGLPSAARHRLPARKPNRPMTRFRATRSSSLGYNVAGPRPKNLQRRGAAVAISVRLRVNNGLPGDANDDHARLSNGGVDRAGALRVASIYLPQRNPPDTEKYSTRSAGEAACAYARERL